MFTVQQRYDIQSEPKSLGTILQTSETSLTINCHMS